MIRKPTILMAMLAALSVVAACGGSDAEDSNGSTKAADDGSGCAPVAAPKPKQDGGAPQPKSRLDPAKTNTITFRTSCGDFTVTLDVKGAPSTTASVAALARTGFYDHTVFHRIVPGFVIQGGDPTGKGTGGPGYKTVDEPPSDAAYTRGVVAMAKTQHEAPGTAGSQFYVVTAADSGLPPEYAIIGKVTRGMKTVKRIEALGTASEEPQRPVVIEKATFSAK
ncbi:MAG TPA: peptidylprolyl isomerase [Aeromicrobium sp.]|nr:peptidylprolyl isomerase [Aeromicrobium sp.]